MSVPCQHPASNPENWFASLGSEAAAQAKRACFQSCPLLNQCADVALSKGIPFGIWGGVDERERERIWQANGGRPSVFQDELDAALSGVTFRSSAA